MVTITCSVKDSLGATATTTVSATVSVANGSPVVTGAAFTVALPVTVGQSIGTILATNNPTSWVITSGNAKGYFAINNIGLISTHK